MLSQAPSALATLLNASNLYRSENHFKRRLVATNAMINVPIKNGTRNRRGASSKKVNEAIMSAPPIDKSKRVPPIPVANPRTRRRVPEPSFPNTLPNPLTMPVDYSAPWIASNGELLKPLVESLLRNIVIEARVLYSQMPTHAIPSGDKGVNMSVRDQERRAREAMRKSDEVASRIERRMKGAERQAKEATLRAEEVRRSIEVGDVQPRPLPSLREDSMESMESIKSMKSIESIRSMESAKKLDEAEGEGYSEDYGKGKDHGKDYGYGLDYGEPYGKDR